MKITRKVFKKPTREEIAAFALEIDYNLNVDRFLDHYDSVGWMIGAGKPMKDWKAAVRNWKRRDEEKGLNTHAKPTRSAEPELTDEQKAIIAEINRKGLNYG